MRNVKLLVLADDYTGALDTGVQFSKQGIPTLVTFTQNLESAYVWENIQVCVINLHSRHDTAEEAYKKTYDAAKAAYQLGVTSVYKKTDSTLRGNIGAELEGLLDASGGKKLHFVPAFPKNERVTINGIHFVNGHKISESAFARDPFEPVRNSSVADIVAEQSAVDVVVNGNAIDRPAIYVHDAATDDDLKRIALDLENKSEIRAMAGCAGFAEHLSTILHFTKREVPSKRNGKSVLLVSGSLNDITIRQTEQARQDGMPIITLTTEQKLSPNYWKELDNQEFYQEVKDGIEQKGIVVIETINSGKDLEQTRNFQEIIGEDEVERTDRRIQTQENISDMVKNIMRHIDIDTLVVFGGDTLISIVQKLECIGILPLYEITPGVVVCEGILKKGKITIVSKSGGFGGKNIIRNIYQYIAGGKHKK